ncbi:hypothetical protein [Streptomyces thermolilacinus]|nr:hypothetical protein [Streptomyces thermolilacinus]
MSSRRSAGVKGSHEPLTTKQRRPHPDLRRITAVGAAPTAPSA